MQTLSAFLRWIHSRCVLYETNPDLADSNFQIACAQQQSSEKFLLKEKSEAHWSQIGQHVYLLPIMLRCMHLSVAISRYFATPCLSPFSCISIRWSESDFHRATFKFQRLQKRVQTVCFRDRKSFQIIFSSGNCTLVLKCTCQDASKRDGWTHFNQSLAAPEKKNLRFGSASGEHGQALAPLYTNDK